ncbi:hypothetical protein UFOVP517_17 [uncultured Caudovirales phage]|jgi:hypothetical protein|uniref:Uncharacterized protein n=1 Tax=uncultured Caudovirales phage TaxID=2100421 RepID=A0A6J5MML5_9CAUD|nr:hypothetical protein UFOVP517_17 [uncultured Caudovirales phage]
MPVFQLNELGDDFMEVQAGGTTYRLSPLTLGGRSRLQAVVRKLADNPMDLSKEAMRDMPPQVAAEIFNRACQRRAYWPPAIDSEDGVALILRSLELQTAVVGEMLAKFQPELTKDQVAKLVEGMDPTAFATLATFAWTGKRPDDPNFPADQATQSTGTS